MWLLAVRPVYYLIAFGLVACVAGGFYASKLWQEHQYKKEIEKDQQTFSECIMTADNAYQYQLCYERIKQ